MKTDITTSVVAVIAGIVIAFFITNMFIPPLEDVSFKVLTAPIDSSLTEPDKEVFNYRSINPTVEVYVGECTEFDEDNNCIDGNYDSKAEDGDTD